MVARRNITSTQWVQLRACSNNKMTLTATAKQMGVGHGWLQRSAKRLGREQELRDLFPERFHQLNQFRLTPERIDRLKSLTAAGEPRRAIAERLGCCHMTLNKAIKAAGLMPEINRITANRRGSGHVEPANDNVLPRDSDPAVQWLTRAWRKAA